MKTLPLFCVFVALSQAWDGPSLVKEDKKTDCRRGPRIYCKSFRLARECEAVDFCAKFDWEKRVVRQVDESDNTCRECLHQSGGVIDAALNQLPRSTACVLSGMCEYQSASCADLDEYAQCTDRWAQMRLRHDQMDARCEQCQQIVSEMEVSGENLLENINASCNGSTECAGPILKHFTQLIGLKKRKSSPAIRPSVLCSLVGQCGKPPLLTHHRATQRDSVMCSALWHRVRDMGAAVDKDLLIAECARAPGFSRAECVEVVHHSVPLMQRHQSAGLLTQASTCQHLGTWDLSVGELEEIQAGSDLGCEVCIVVANTAKQMITESGPNVVERIQYYVDTYLCKKFPLIRQKCQNLVYNETDLLLDYLENMDAVETCRALHVCAAPQPPTTVTGVVCSKCEDVVMGIRMSAICRTKKLFNFMITRLCDFIPGAQDKCAIAVSEMKDWIVLVIQKVFDPSFLCRPLCSGGGDDDDDAMITINLEELINARQDLNFFEKTVGLVHLAMGDSRRRRREDSAANCDACLNLPWNQMALFKSGDQMEHFVRELACDSSDSKCGAFVTNFASALSSLVRRHGVSAGDACHALNVCSRRRLHPPPRTGQCSTSDFPSFAVYDSCAACSALDMRDIRAAAASSSVRPSDSPNKDEIERRLKMVCMDAHCLRFMDDHAASLSGALLISPPDGGGDLCRVLNVCPTAATNSDDHCLVCHLMSKQLDHLLSEAPRPPTEKAVEASLPKACQAIGRRFERECSDLLFHFQPAIVNAIASELSVPPLRICPQLGICKAHHDDDESAAPASSISCPVCVAVVEEFERLVVKNSTREEMLRDAILVCKRVFPHQYEAECESFVTANIDRMIAAIVHMNALSVCQTFALCSAPPPPPAPKPTLDLTYCSLCQLVVMTGRAFAEQDHLVDKAVSLATHTLCAKFQDKDSKRDCTDLMDAVARVLNLIVDKTDSLVLCTSIFDVCPTPNKLYGRGGRGRGGGGGVDLVWAKWLA